MTSKLITVIHVSTLGFLPWELYFASMVLKWSPNYSIVYQESKWSDSEYERNWLFS